MFMIHSKQVPQEHTFVVLVQMYLYHLCEIYKAEVLCILCYTFFTCVCVQEREYLKCIPILNPCIIFVHIDETVINRWKIDR